MSAVLHILLRVIQQELIERWPNTPKNARLGAVSFTHRFGDALNEHIHFHCCVIDALFYLMDGELRTSELPALGKADFAAIQTRVSQRVLRWFVRALLSTVSRPSMTSISAITSPSHKPTAPPSCLSARWS